MFPNKKELLEEKCRLLRNFRSALSACLFLLLISTELLLAHLLDKGIFDRIQMLTLSLGFGFLSGFSASKISDAYVLYLNKKLNTDFEE